MDYSKLLPALSITTHFNCTRCTFVGFTQLVFKLLGNWEITCPNCKNTWLLEIEGQKLNLRQIRKEEK